MIVGDQAKMYAAGDYAEHGTQIVGDVKELDPEYPDQPRPREGMVHRHAATRSSRRCRTSPTTPARWSRRSCSATWPSGSAASVEWDPKNLKPLNDPSLERIVHCEYRDGYQV